MFQVRLSDYGVYEALKHYREISWKVSRYGPEINEGDDVYLWAAGGRGIIASGRIVDQPHEAGPADRVGDEYWANEQQTDGVVVRVRLRLLRQPLSKAEALQHPLLSGMQILRAPRGTNFRVDPQEHAAIAALVHNRVDVADRETLSGGGYPDPQTSASIDTAGIKIALEAIEGRFRGCQIELMRHSNPGFDIHVSDDHGVTVAYVEIKSTATSRPAFFLSENERAFAERHAGRYHLLLVTSVDVAAGTGLVHWRDGALEGSDLDLRPRQWRGELLSPRAS
jgi:Domain of unknown function (DUF3883)/EVE domain